jgi:Holliday junction resolvase RusA-like endonuclease
MTALDFTLDLVPPEMTAQQKGVRLAGGKIHHFTKEAVREWMNAVALASAPFRPSPALRGPVKATLTFTFPWRDRETERAKSGGWLPRDTKPDWDNLAKATVDALALAGFFAKGDQQIADGRVLKGWGNKPGLRVRLSEWDYQLSPVKP